MIHVLLLFSVTWRCLLLVSLDLLRGGWVALQMLLTDRQDKFRLAWYTARGKNKKSVTCRCEVTQGTTTWFWLLTWFWLFAQRQGALLYRLLHSTSCTAQTVSLRALESLIIDMQARKCCVLCKSYTVQVYKICFLSHQSQFFGVVAAAAAFQ